MVDPLFYNLLLPSTVLVVFCLESPTSCRNVCIGGSVEVFENITSIRLKAEITLYKQLGNKNKPHPIAVWNARNNQDSIRDTYKQKLSLRNETIMLHDFQISDEALYILHLNESTQYEVQLCAYFPPNFPCNLEIIKEENHLIAFLVNQEDCGHPLLYVKWKDPFDNSSELQSHASVEISSGHQGGTYTACMEGETLKCVKRLSKWDYCKNYTEQSLREYNNPTNTDIAKESTNYVTITMLLFIALGVIVIIALLLLRKQECLGRDDKDSRLLSNNDADHTGLLSNDVRNERLNHVVGESSSRSDRSDTTV